MSTEEMKGFEELFEEAIAADSIKEDGHTEEAEVANVEADTDNAPDDAQDDADRQDNISVDADKDYKAMYEQEVQRTRSWDGRLSAKDKEIAALKSELGDVKKQLEQLATNKGDESGADEAIEAFLKEFPELATPIQKMIEKATKTRTKELATDIEGRIESRIKPIAQTIQESTVEKHFRLIRDAHSDFDALVKSGDIQTWINEQPSYMQAGLQSVYNEGTTSDVIDLLTRYKAARNIGTVTPSTANTHHRRPAAAVKSRPSTPMSRNTQIDENDFDGALKVAFGTKS